MSLTNVEIPDEPPPAYEATQQGSGSSANPATSPPAAVQSHHQGSARASDQTPAQAQAQAQAPGPAQSGKPATSNGSAADSTIRVQSTGASTNPFLSAAEASTAASSSSSTSHNPFFSNAESSSAATTTAAAATTAAPQKPELPVRRYNTGTNSSAANLSPNPTGTGSSLGRVPSNASSLYAPAEAAIGSSLDRLSLSDSSDHARPSNGTATSAAVSPPPPSPPPAATSSSSLYRPPPGRPPPPQSPSAASPSSSASGRGARASQNQYRPTTAPTPGQPLLRNGKLLVYPKTWTGCHKCGDTGYKHGDPTHPCRKCWDKYGKTYSGALAYSVGLNDPAFKLQRPLPAMAATTANHSNLAGYVPPPGNWHPGPSHSYVAGGYPGAIGAGPGSQPPYGNHPGGPYSPAPPRPQPPAVQRSDAETEASRMPDAPPTYHDANNVGAEERLPAQYVAPPAPPPGSTPTTHHRPPGPPPGPPSQGYPYHGGYGGGGDPYHRPPPPLQQAGAPRPVMLDHRGGFVPRGALVVMPGDPRIGGRLCYECGGRGILESFWFGDETCYRCRGSGRIF